MTGAAFVRCGVRSARITMLAALLMLGGCGSIGGLGLKLPSLTPPAEPPLPGVEPSTAAVARVRAALLTLRSDPALAARVPAEISDAEAAVDKADISQHDKAAGSHLIYLAERKVDYARTLAEVRALEAEYQALRLQRDGLKGGAAP